MSELLLGRYSIIKPLVEREDFAVHIGKDTTTGEKLVVKVAPSSIASYQPEHECHILTRYLVDCPYVPRLVNVGYDEATKHRIYVHTPLGRELALMFELLEDVLPGDAVIFRQCFLTVMGPKAVEALTAIHAKGVIHRDIKPSNLVEHEGKIMFIVS